MTGQLHKYASVGSLIIIAALTTVCGIRTQFAVTPTPAIAVSDTPLPPNPPPATATSAPAPTNTQTHTPIPLSSDTPMPEPITPSVFQETTAPATPTGPLPAESPTPDIPLVTVNVDLNVRSGPGTHYDRIGLLPAGSTTEIRGRNEEGSWWQIIYPDSPAGLAWISADYGTADNADDVPLAAIPPTPIPPTPAQPTPTAVPPTPPVDFMIVKQRLWSNEENGGISINGSVTNCGYGHEIYVTVIDAAGTPLDGVVIGDTYNNPRQITGSIGPGRAQYILFTNGYNLFVAEDQSAGRPVTSETSRVLSAKEIEIPIPWLIEAHYCANEEECADRISKVNLCWGHYSYDIVFQRAW